MMIIRFILIALIVFVVLVLGAVGIATYRGISVQEATDIFRVRSSSKIFREAEYGISFRYPKNWKWKYIYPGTIVFGAGEGVVMTLVLSKNKEKESLETFSKRNIKEISESSQSAESTVTLETATPRLLSSLRAESMVYHTAKEGETIDGIQVWAVNDKNTYIFTLASSRDQFQTAVQVFQNVFESVQIK